MTRTRPPSRTPVERGRRRKRRDRLAFVLVVLLAIGAGLLAGYLGSPKSWEKPVPAPGHAAIAPNEGST